MFRILIAEDDKGTRRLLEDTLADVGYEPISAADGQAALQLLTRKHGDLLIPDAWMPRMDGFALRAALRRSGSQLPVLMLTAKEALADKKQGLRLGADDYMTKPADEEEMLLRIQALLRRTQAISRKELFWKAIFQAPSTCQKVAHLLHDANSADQSVWKPSRFRPRSSQDILFPAICTNKHKKDSQLSASLVLCDITF